MAAIRAGAAALLIVLSAAAAAADCVSDARVLSTRGNVPNLITGPAAWSGLLLAVAKTEEEAPNEIWLALYGEELETLVGDRRIVTDAGARDGIIDLLWNDLEFNLFYRSATERIHLQRLTPFGEPIGGPIVINPERRARIGDSFEAVWSPALNATVIAHHVRSGSARGIYVTLVDRGGAQRPEERLIAVPTTSTDLEVAVTESGVTGIFFTAEDGEIWLATIPPGGFFPTLETTGIDGTDFEVTAQGELFVVTRVAVEEVEEEEEITIHWFVIDTDHEIVREDEELVEPADGPALHPLSLSSTGDELVLTYEGPFGMRLRRFTISGGFLSDGVFAASNSAATDAMSAFAPVWTGTSFIIAPVREISLTSYLLRYCPLVVEIIAPDIVPVGEPVLLIGTASGGEPPYEFQWTISRDPGGPRRQEAILRTFPTTGPRTLTLTVTDDDGNVTVATKTIEVSDTPPPPPPPPARRRSVRH
jgi:hypothetical protein